MSTITQPAKELREAWGDVVATNDSGWLQDCDGGYASTLTRYQRPATTLYDRTDGRFLPIYQTEFDLAVIRAMGRTLAQVSPALVGAVRSMCNYTIGEGFTFTANRDDTAELSPSKSQKLVDAVQREINTLLDDMDFVGSFDREIHNSSIEDGEVFLQLKPRPCGGVKISRCEPDQVRQPASSRELEDWVSDTFEIACDEFVSSWSFGVHTRADEPDVALGYHVVADETGVNWEYIPASRMEHIKRNVPRNAKRGFSDFYPIEADSTRGEKLRRNMAEGAAVQSAIAYVRQHVQGATRTGIEQMLGENRVGTSQQQIPWGGSRPRSVVQYRPGTVVDLSAGLEYKPGPMGSDRANDFMVVAQYVQRMQAVRWSMPEYMFTGDASNANYSSTLVAESPFVKSCEAEQRFYSRHFVSLIWKALQIRWELGAFDQFGLAWEELEQTIEIKAECPAVATRDALANVQRQEILIRLGILSRKTAASQNGLDFESEVELGATPEGQEGGESSSGDSVTEVGLAEQILLECNGKGGKPGPCPKYRPEAPKKGRRRQNHIQQEHDGANSPLSHEPSKFVATKHADSVRSRHRNDRRLQPEVESPNDTHAKPHPEADDTGSDPTASPIHDVSEKAKPKSNLLDKRRQGYVAKAEKHVAKQLHGDRAGDNAPTDVVVTRADGTEAHVEVKVLLDRKTHRIDVDQGAIDRKARLHVEEGHDVYTIVLDRRNKFNYRTKKGANYSGHHIYIQEGCGPMAVKKMYRVNSMEEAEEIVRKLKAFPEDARAHKKWHEAVLAIKNGSDRGVLKSVTVPHNHS